MAYDAATGQVVLFGGLTGTSGYLGDTWTYQVGAASTPTSNVGAAAAQTPVSFNILTAGTLPTLSNSNVLTQGAPNLDFTLGTGSTCTGAVTAGQACTINVAFTPRFPGQRLGAVNLYDSTGTNVIATALVSGTGTGPAITFPSNTTSTIVGSGFYYAHGAAVDSAGNVYVADTSNSAIKEILAINGVVSSSSSIITLGSGFSYPYDVAVDSAGNVYVADSSNNAVKEILAVGGVTSATSTVITIGSGFSGPNGVAVDAAGDVFVTDTGNTAVKEILAVNGAVSSTSSVITIGSGFNYPRNVAVDSAGNVYVADATNNAIKEILAVNGAVSSSSTVITLGSGFNGPYGVAVDSAGNVYVADSSNNAIKEILAVNGVTSSTSTVITLGTGFKNPYTVSVDGAGNVYLTDFLNNAVKEIPLATAPALSFPNTAVGSSSATQTVTVQNIGNAGLTLPAPSTGTNPSLSPYFTLGNTSTCSSGSAATTLAPGATCTEILSYSPTIAGSVTGNLVFTDNNLNAANATQTVVETGNTTSALTIDVVGQAVPQGTASVVLELCLSSSSVTAATLRPPPRPSSKSMAAQQTWAR